MRQGAGVIDSVSAKIKQEKGGELRGLVTVRYGPGNTLTFLCLRRSPCEWEALEKRLNGRFVESKNLNLESEAIGALEEAWQKEMYSGSDDC